MHAVGSAWASSTASGATTSRPFGFPGSCNKTSMKCPSASARSVGLKPRDVRAEHHKMHTMGFVGRETPAAVVPWYPWGHAVAVQ